MSNTTYSYHTFLFPFIWKGNGNKKGVENKEFKENMSDSWKERKREDVTGSDYTADYAIYQYLTIPARKLILPEDDSSIVKDYDFLYEKMALNEKCEYIITKEEEKFYLKLKKIRLKVFDIGIAIMIFETEYNGKKEKGSKREEGEFCLDDINKINEYGRRINLAYISARNGIAADRIEISLSDGKKVFSEDFGDTAKRYYKEGKKLNWTHILNPIKELLSFGNDECKFTSNEKNKENEGYIYIYPAIDDRMFVCCIIRNQELSDEIRGEKTGDYLKDWDKVIGDKENNTQKDCRDEAAIANKLYKFFYIEKDLSCKNTMMKKEILEETIYPRWTDTGTIYAITHHSFMGVASSDPQKEFVINTFLKQYVQLVILVLVQRATILLLSSQIACCLSPNEELDSNKIEEIELLQKDYVRAQSQIFLSEVTIQEQGVELFQMLIKQLYIKKNKAVLDSHMENLRDVADISNGRIQRGADVRLNNMLAVVSCMGFLLAIIQIVPFVIDEFSISGVNKCHMTIGAIVILLIIFIVYIVRSNRSKLKKKFEKRKNK